MNRRIASSQGSPVDDTQAEAQLANGDVSVQSGAADKAPRQKKQSGGKDGDHSTGKKAKGKSAPGDVGQMLRGAYRQTVDEAIPDDLMDLLNRLE